MSKLLKLGVYVAAGVGTYEVLRRYGLLEKAGKWLSEQVPDDYKDRATEYGNQLRDRAHDVTGQVREKANDIGSQLRERAQQYGGKAQQAVDAATNAVKQATGYTDQPQQAGATTTGGTGNGASHGTGSSSAHTPQNITGPGRGSSTATDEVNGGHVPHTVGRGVVR